MAFVVKEKVAEYLPDSAFDRGTIFNAAKEIDPDLTKSLTSLLVPKPESAKYLSSLIFISYSSINLVLISMINNISK